MLRASLGKVVHTVKRAGTYAAKVSHKELHKIAVHVRAVVPVPYHKFTFVFKDTGNGNKLFLCHNAVELKVILNIFDVDERIRIRKIFYKADILDLISKLRRYQYLSTGRYRTVPK